MSSTPLTMSFIGALQASLSVLLTLVYGLIAARYQLLKESSAKDVSKLCVNMFLPMLIVTNVGSQIDLDTLKRYYPIMLWSCGYAILSILYGAIFVKFLELPSWTTPACSFNNTTSLPARNSFLLLLVQSLAVTGLLDPIAGGNVDQAVERSKSYFIINSMLSNGLTFAFGPKLLNDEPTGEGKMDNSSRRCRRGSYYSDNFSPDDIECHTEEGNGETTHLLPSKIQTPLSSTYDKISMRMNTWFHKLPNTVQAILSFLASMANAPLLGAALALIIGLIPPLHKVMFNDMQAGGWLKAWLTSSLRHVGELFTALQMFVVGTRLSTSNYQEMVEGEVLDPRVPRRSLAVIYLWRFILMPIASISIIYMLAKKKLLSDDPVLWFSMMLMPCGPPAILLSSLAELKGNTNTRLQVAKLLMVSYAITPVICFTVVSALKVSEAVARAN
ncbi:auxin efflux carrier [Terfezia claveryi]|nr:auxin efflux carrier [Terfezia claveryi]